MQQDVTIFSYQPLAGQRQPRICISIDFPMPLVEDISEQGALMDEQAGVLADALIHNLPSGTLHRLSALLLRHSAGVMCRRDEDRGKYGIETIESEGA